MARLLNKNYYLKYYKSDINNYIIFIILNNFQINL